MLIDPHKIRIIWHYPSSVQELDHCRRRRRLTFPVTLPTSINKPALLKRPLVDYGKALETPWITAVASMFE